MIDLAPQLLAHIVGDYFIQSDWMAVEKKDRSVAAGAHALTYALPFLALTRSPAALAVIVGTHFVIDRWRLARFICWFKNFVGSPWSFAAARAFVSWSFAAMQDFAVWAFLRALRQPVHLTPPPIPDVVWSPYRRPWSECTATGYPDNRPAWLAVWLLIIVDNTLHVGINALALWAWRTT